MLKRGTKGEVEISGIGDKLYDWLFIATGDQQIEQNIFLDKSKDFKKL